MNSLSEDQKDRSNKESHLGFVKDDKRDIMVGEIFASKTNLRDALSIKFLQ